LSRRRLLLSPLILSAKTLTGTTPSKCDLAHNRYR
jgi:hypothetical protein